MGLNIGIIIANIITLLGVIGVPIYQNYKKEKNEKKNHELKIRLGIFKTLEFLEGRCKKVLKEYNGSGDFLDYDRIPIFGLIQLKHLGEIKFYTKEYFTETYKKFIEIEKKLLEISDYKGLERTKEEYGEGRICK